MSPRWRLVVLGGLFALATACSGAGDDPDGVASISESNTPSSAAQAGDGDSNGDSDVDQMRAYAKCMRENGVDMADPDPNSPGSGGIAVNGPEEKDTADKAMAACKHLMPNGGEPEKPSAEDLDAMRATAKCLREHGIDVKDPTMENPGISVSAGDGAGNDPDELNKAMKECMPADAKTEMHGQSGDGK
jgi:hypothetical protein